MIRSALPAVAAVLLALGIAGCGGASSRQKRGAALGHGAVIMPRLDPRYRWLVRTAGPPPGIAAENRAPGTRAWRLRGPSGDVGGLAWGTVRGYVAQQALAPGQTERIYVSAPRTRQLRIRIFRMGWYHGTGGREVLMSQRLPAVRQPPCTHRFVTGLTECDWRPTLSFAIPVALPSGVYIVKLSARTGESDCLFVVRSGRPQPLLAQLPTSTYEAYNAWGGDSLYPGGHAVKLTGTTQGIEVSYDRPYGSVTGAGQFFARDVAMIRFLERYGYPVSYTTSESVDRDPGQLTGHRAVIDFGHSEYWSVRQERAFAHALQLGTSLLFFGSDTLAWRVRYAPASAAASQAGEPNQSIIAYKQYRARDRDRHDRTGAFSDGGARLADSAYLGCITPRLAQPGPPTYRYYAWAPAPRLRPAWLFAGTRITRSKRIPGIVGYELDQRTRFTPRQTKLIGSGAAPCMSRSSPEGGRLTPGAAMAGPGGGLAETTLHTAPSGAIVFDTGTLGWELGLEPVPSASPDAPRAPDPRVVQMTRNLLAHVLGKSPQGATP